MRALLNLRIHSNLKVDISEAKIDENFANYFLKPKFKTIVL